MPSDRAQRVQHRERVRQNLLDAAHQLLDTEPWPEVTVERIARAAQVSRTTLYQHFSDRQELLLTLFGGVTVDLEHVADDWMRGGDDPAAEHRRSLVALVDVFAEHGRLLQAVSDAAVSDPDVAAAWNQLADGLVDASTEAIARDVANGHTDVADPEQMSRALSAMMERYLLRSFGRPPFPDRAVAADTLATVWIRTLYNRA